MKGEVPPGGFGFTGFLCFSCSSPVGEPGELGYRSRFSHASREASGDSIEHCLPLDDDPTLGPFILPLPR
jgi:hypothetical protein